MRYALLLTILLAGCGKTCEEMGGKVTAGAPFMFMDGDKLKTIYPTRCDK